MHVDIYTEEHNYAYIFIYNYCVLLNLNNFEHRSMHLCSYGLRDVFISKHIDIEVYSHTYIYPNGANFHDAILGNVKSRNSYQVFF